MRLSYLASGPVPSPAANAVHVAHMCAALARSGVEVRLHAPSPTLVAIPRYPEIKKQYGLQESFEVSPVWAPRLRGGGRIYRSHLAWKLLRYRPDIVYGRHLAGTLTAQRLGMTTVFEAHKPDWEKNLRVQRQFERLIRDRYFLALVVISRSLAAYVEQQYPELMGRVIVAPDAGPEWPIPGEPKSGSKFIVGYFGSLYAGRGIETILKVASLCPWAEFRVVGGAPGDVERLAADKGAAQNIHFLGRRAHSELYSLMAECEVLVAPYGRSVQIHGGGGDTAKWMSPLKIFEYMAMNRPIVASDLPALREVLENERNSLLVEPDDAFAWRDAIVRLRDNPGLRRSLAETARTEFDASYTWGARAIQIMRELERLGAEG